MYQYIPIFLIIFRTFLKLDSYLFNWRIETQRVTLDIFHVVRDHYELLDELFLVFLLAIIL